MQFLEATKTTHGKNYSASMPSLLYGAWDLEITVDLKVMINIQR